MVKRSVALAAWGEEGLLLVKRPEEDPEFPGVYGLPAVSQEEGESLEEAARRVAREKLSTEVRLRYPVAFGREERPGHTLELWVYEADLLFPQACPSPGRARPTTPPSASAAPRTSRRRPGRAPCAAASTWR